MASAHSPMTSQVSPWNIWKTSNSSSLPTFSSMMSTRVLMALFTIWLMCFNLFMLQKQWDCFLTRFIISKTWTKEWVTSLKTDLKVGDKIDRTSFQRWPLIPTRVSMTGLTSINIFGRFAKFEKSLIRTWWQEKYLTLNIIQLILIGFLAKFKKSCQILSNFREDVG